MTRQGRSFRDRRQPDLPFFSEIDYKGKLLVECPQQDVEKDAHLRRTARAGPMEAFKHIVLALPKLSSRLLIASNV